MQVLQQALKQRSEGVRYQPVLLPSRTWSLRRRHGTIVARFQHESHECHR